MADAVIDVIFIIIIIIIVIIIITIIIVIVIITIVIIIIMAPWTFYCINKLLVNFMINKNTSKKQPEINAYWNYEKYDPRKHVAGACSHFTRFHKNDV